jgi:hypothetical protein
VIPRPSADYFVVARPKAKRVGENVSLIMNQEKMARWDYWLHNYAS